MNTRQFVMIYGHNLIEHAYINMKYVRIINKIDSIIKCYYHVFLQIANIHHLFFVIYKI